jgi:hypothetical protein
MLSNKEPFMLADKEPFMRSHHDTDPLCMRVGCLQALKKRFEGSIAQLRKAQEELQAKRDAVAAEMAS